MVKNSTRYPATCLAWLVVFLFPCMALGQANRQRNKDIDHMIRELATRHAHLYHTVAREELQARAGALKKRTAHLSNDEFLLEVERLLSLVGDGHTTLNIPYNPSVHHRRLPFKLLRASNGYVITSATETYSHLAGKLLQTIEGTDILTLEQNFRTGLAADNEFTYLNLVPEYLVIPALLRAKKLITDTNFIRITLLDEKGRRDSMVVLPVSKEIYRQLPATTREEDKPLWLQSRGKKFWMQWLPEPSILYVQLNSSDIGGQEKEMEAFAAALIRSAMTNKAKNLVLDLRRNHGGSIWRTRPLLHAFITINSLDTNCRLFVFTSPHTYSAATALAGLVNEHTDAVFVGQPTGGKPNSFGDIGRFLLPNTGLQVRYSRLYVPGTNPYDTRPSIYPDIYVSYPYPELLHRDPCLQAVQHYRPPKALAVPLRSVIESKGIKEGTAYYHQLKKDSLNTYAFNEMALLDLVSEFRKEQKTAWILPLLELNAAEYPWSGYTFSLLGEAYTANQQPKEAEAAFRKAFQLSKYYSKWADLYP